MREFIVGGVKTDVPDNPIYFPVDRVDLNQKAEFPEDHDRGEQGCWEARDPIMEKDMQVTPGLFLQ